MSILKNYEAKKVDATTNEILTAYLNKCIEEGAIRDGSTPTEIDFESKDVKGYVPRKHCINVVFSGEKITSAKEPLKLEKSLAPNGNPIYVVLYRWSGLVTFTKPISQNSDSKIFDFNLTLRNAKLFFKFLFGELFHYLIETWEDFLNLISTAGKDFMNEAYRDKAYLDKKITEIPKVHQAKQASEKLASIIKLENISQLSENYIASSEDKGGMAFLFYSKSQKWLQLVNNDDIASTMQNFTPHANGIVPAATMFPGDITHVFSIWVKDSSIVDGYTDESGALYGKIAFYDQV